MNMNMVKANVMKPREKFGMGLTHKADDVAPAAGVLWPALQGTHALWFTNGLYAVTGQRLHEEVAPALKLPAGQPAHCVAPADADINPAGQFKH